VLATIQVLFSDGTRWYGIPVVFSCWTYGCKDVQIIYLKKMSYDSSTVAHISERFEPNTVLWAFHTIQLSSFCFKSTFRLSVGFPWEVHNTATWLQSRSNWWLCATVANGFWLEFVAHGTWKLRWCCRAGHQCRMSDNATHTVSVMHRSTFSCHGTLLNAQFNGQLHCVKVETLQLELF